MQAQPAPNPFVSVGETTKKVPRSTLVSRNVTISGHRTSVRLEPDMWSGLSEICRRERANIHEVCTSVALYKADNTSLTAAIRVFVMAYFRASSTEDGHVKAGHGYGAIKGAANNVGTHAMPGVMPGTVVGAMARPVASTSVPVSQTATSITSPMVRQNPVSPFTIGASRVNKDGMR